MVPFLVALVAGFAVAQLATFATTVYLHRTLSHRAIATRPFVSWCFRFLLWITTGIRPREWVAVHRKHHAFTDVEGDPHSPRLLGWVNVQFGNVRLYRKVATDPAQVRRYARDLPPDRWDRVLFDHSFLGLAIGIGILIAVFGPWVGLLAAGLHTVMYLSLNAAVNAITHTFGDRPFDNTATNLQWVALLTMGEGLHNNHHAAPTSAKLALSKGEIDPAWPAIALATRLRLMTIRHSEVKLKQPIAA
jgi:stearoyl-CoA desaturase (delta-9 desaturase)